LARLLARLLAQARTFQFPCPKCGEKHRTEKLAHDCCYIETGPLRPAYRTLIDEKPRRQ
jgi:hypothetical protein